MQQHYASNHNSFKQAPRAQTKCQKKTRGWIKLALGWQRVKEKRVGERESEAAQAGYGVFWDDDPFKQTLPLATATN